MATCIHHGPPGSYKTFTLVQRIAIPALKSGRTLITNIRDFDSLEKIKAAFPQDEFPQTANLINVGETEAGKGEIARFFHWAPPGALIIIDEGQRIYPKRRDFKLSDLDQYQPKPDQEIAVLLDKHGNPMKRPETIEVAFDMQRHWNWDIYVSTPNIDKLHDFIRQVSEWAYRHRSLDGVLPWMKGTWYEHQHDSESSGKSKSHIVGVPTKYRVDQRVYNCYSSTATGSHLESKAGRSILSDPKLRLLALLIVLALGLMGWNLTRIFSRGTDTPPPSVAGNENPVSRPDTPGVNVDHRQNDTSPVVAPERTYSLIERSGDQTAFLVREGDRQYKVRDYVLIKQGFAVITSGDCHAHLYQNGKYIDASCEQIECRVQITYPGRLIRRDCDVEATPSKQSSWAGSRAASDNERARRDRPDPA